MSLLWSLGEPRFVEEAIIVHAYVKSWRPFWVWLVPCPHSSTFSQKIKRKNIFGLRFVISIDTSARPVFRSLYKTITNCALCDYLHAVFSKRIWITWLWLKILNWKNANWIFGQKWNSWNSMRQIRKKTAVIEARLLIFSNAIMTNDVIIRQHWVREMQNHEGRQQKNERQEKEESLTFVKDALWGELAN